MHPGWVVPHVLIMSTRQLCHPVVFLVLMKADNRLSADCRVSVVHRTIHVRAAIAYDFLRFPEQSSATLQPPKRERG